MAERVLVADSDPQTLTALQETLQAQEFSPVAVSTVDGVREAFRLAVPHACILAASLSDGSGLDLLRELRRDHPDVPVVILGSSSAVPLVVAAMRLGAADYAVRPADPLTVVGLVRNALSRVRQEKELERIAGDAGDLSTRILLDDILKDLVLKGGSDLHLKVGRPPLMRLDGQLVPSEFPILGEEDVNAFILQVLGKKRFQTLKEEFELDTSYVLPDLARFRVNCSKRMDQFGATFRLVPIVIPTIDSMNLPPVLRDLCKVSQGLILLTGPTGCGKSTSLAAMVQHLNETEPLHVVTIEDPVEFVYSDKLCTINQRQLGTDVKSLAEALRRVLRQDPDVILMGEMRDVETLELAMHAAETGHLVFSTLHTNDAKQTIDRIVDMFPSDASHQIRSMLAMTLHAVVSQRLIRRADGQGRVAAVEVMINSPQIRELIAEGKTSSIEKAIASSGDYYRMQTFNQALAKLVQSGAVKEDEALTTSMNPGDLRLLLRGVVSGSAGAFKDPPVPTPTPPPMSRDSTKIKINRGF